MNVAEFVVAASVSLGFLTGAAQHGIPWLPVIGLVIGGVIIAPIAARLAGRLPHAPMGTLVGGLVVMVNGVTVVAALGGVPGWLDAVLLLLAGLITCTYSRRAWTLEKNSRSGSDHELLSDS